MITPGVFDMRMWQGATWHYQILWEDGDPATPVDLTDYEARMMVRATALDDTVALELDSLLGGAGGITLGGAAGTIELDATATETAHVAPGWYVYDLELEDSTGEVTRLLEGKFAVIAEVTRDA